MTMMRTWLVAALWLGGCGGSDDDLGREDVENLPPGDATGSAASGSYALALLTTACSGTCAVHSGSFTLSLCDVNDRDTGAITVVQAEGALAMDAQGLVLAHLTGGLDRDGRFLVGAWGTESGGEVEIAVRASGTLDGNQLTGVADARSRGSALGQRVDCQARFDVTGTRN